ncbi:MAG: hypothetical protein WAV18_12440 [Roseiarcus sp.]
MREVSPTHVSWLTRGQFRNVSVERLVRRLMRLGCVVETILQSRDDQRRRATFCSFMRST